MFVPSLRPRPERHFIDALDVQAVGAIERTDRPVYGRVARIQKAGGLHVLRVGITHAGHVALGEALFRAAPAERDTRIAERLRLCNVAELWVRPQKIRYRNGPRINAVEPEERIRHGGAERVDGGLVAYGRCAEILISALR